MVKARVGVRVKEAIGGSAKSKNRSADLVALTEQYNALKAKLKSLIVALKNQHAAMHQLNKTRMEVANQIAYLSEKSPLNESAAKLPTEQNQSVCSYRSVHMELNKRSNAYADKYSQFIVDYAIEWDRVITTRISAGLKQAEVLRRDLDHYQQKVESLRRSTNSTLAKGKQVDTKTAERLGRNEEKLVKAKEQYNKFATDMCILIEEVTERSWKDLHPILVKLAQFDATISSDENKALSELSSVVHQLKALADKHGLTPQARLKDLEKSTPQALSSQETISKYQIEAGPSAPMGGSAGGLTAPIYDPTSMPPGSMAPQGMGGLPVMVAPVSGGLSSTGALSRASSHSSFASAPLSTSEMLTVSQNAAPPPSLEMVHDATKSMTIGENRDRSMSGMSASSGGGLYHRSASYGSEYSGSFSAPPSGSFGAPPSGSFGAPPAPAPAAPPPPPPPAAGLSMYSAPAGMDNIPVAKPLPLGTAGPPDPTTYGYGAQASGGGAAAHPWSTGGAATMASPASGNSNPFGEERRSSNPFDI